MKRFIFIVLLSLCSLATYADCTITASGLTDVAKKELELSCLKAQAVEKVTPEANVEKISKYAGIATEVATAIGIAAKNLGQEVNEFITTPAGMLTVAIILVKIFGKLVGMIFASLLICTILLKILKYMWTEPVEGEPVLVPRWFGILGTREIHRRRFVSYKNASENLVGWTIAAVILMLGSIILVPAVGL